MRKGPKFTPPVYLHATRKENLTQSAVLYFQLVKISIFKNKNGFPIVFRITSLSTSFELEKGLKSPLYSFIDINYTRPDRWSTHEKETGYRN